MVLDIFHRPAFQLHGRDARIIDLHKLFRFLPGRASESNFHDHHIALGGDGCVGGGKVRVGVGVAAHNPRPAVIAWISASSKSESQPVLGGVLWALA